MAILESRTKTGISWVGESIVLFKQSPRKWLLLAIVYLGLFVLLPSVPGLQLFAFITVLIWPIFIAVAIRFYRNAEINKTEDLSNVMRLIQPKVRTLLMLGLVNLFYFILVSLILSADIQALAEIINNQEQLSEQEMMLALQKMVPVTLKLGLLFIPLMMASWFSPMLIAFNDYALAKAIKSSIAGSIQYMPALVAAWLLLSAGIITLMLFAGVLVGLLAFMQPSIAQSLMSVLVFGCFLISIALTLAFQYVSYRDIFRGANSI